VRRWRARRFREDLPATLRLLASVLGPVPYIGSGFSITVPVLGSERPGEAEEVPSEWVILWEPTSR
jgi:hypothetical protein